MYTVLAEMPGATLVTCDAALGMAPGHGAHIEVVG
jgi:hypothetical protein